MEKHSRQTNLAWFSGYLPVDYWMACTSEDIGYDLLSLKDEEPIHADFKIAEKRGDCPPSDAAEDADEYTGKLSKCVIRMALPRHHHSTVRSSS